MHCHENSVLSPLISQKFRKALTLHRCKSSESTTAMLKSSLGRNPLFCPVRKVSSLVVSPPASRNHGFPLSCMIPKPLGTLYEDTMLSCSLCTTFLKCLFLSILLLLCFEGICHEQFPWLRGHSCSWSEKSAESKCTNQHIRDRGNVLCSCNGHSTLGKSQWEIGENLCYSQPSCRAVKCSALLYH